MQVAGVYNGVILTKLLKSVTRCRLRQEAGRCTCSDSSLGTSPSWARACVHACTLGGPLITPRGSGTPPAGIRHPRRDWPGPRTHPPAACRVTGDHPGPVLGLRVQGCQFWRMCFSLSELVTVFLLWNTSGFLPSPVTSLRTPRPFSGVLAAWPADSRSVHATPTQCGRRGAFGISGLLFSAVRRHPD